MKLLSYYKDEGRDALVLILKRFFFYSISLALIFCQASCFSQERRVMNKTVLSVNGRETSTKEFADRLALRLRDFDALYVKDEANLDRAKEETVQAFILEGIAKDYAQKNGLEVSDKELEEATHEIRSKYPDDFAFRRALAEENMAFETWREDMRFTLLQKKIFAKITSALPEPTEAQLKEYYENKKTEFQKTARVRLRQIVLEKEDDAKRILDELSQGADFAKLAKSFSVAPEGANGGDTGWIEKGTLEVFDQAFKMGIGTRSRILKSPYGWHIYEVVQKEPEGRLSFADAKAKIRGQLAEASSQKAFSKWLEEQVRSTSVRRDDSLLKAIKVSTRGS